MTPEQQRIAIAEACGWKPCVHGHPSRPCWVDPRNQLGVRVSFDHLPDYLNDLNAMHKAEKTLTEGQMGAYAYTLLETTQFRTKPKVWLVSATASQRAEAFLKTLNLWKP